MSTKTSGESTVKTTKHFTEREAMDAVYEHEVDRKCEDDRRWSRTVHSIVELDGHHYSIDWDEGLTEMQDDEFFEGDYSEVRPQTTVTAQVVTRWVSVNAPSDDSGDEENIRDYVSMLSPSSRKELSAAIEAAKHGDYSGLKGVNATNGMSDMLAVIERYKELVDIVRTALSDDSDA